MHVLLVDPRVVVYEDGWILHGECPGYRHALLDVLDQPPARLEARVVIQGGEHLATHLLQGKKILGRAQNHDIKKHEIAL